MAYYRLGQSYPRLLQRKDPYRRPRRRQLNVPSGLIVSASNTLVFTQSATCSFILSKTVSQTLTFSQSAHALSSKQNVNQTITFTQTVNDLEVYNRAINHTLTFTQVAEATRLSRASNTLTFSQTATALKTTGVNQTITFTQTATSQYSPHNERPAQVLALTQTLVKALVRLRSVSNTLALSQAATVLKIKNLSVSQLFVMTHQATSGRILRPSNALTLSQTVSVARVLNRSVSNVLQLSQSMNRTVVYVRSLADQLVFQHTYMKPTGIPSNPYIPVPEVIVTKTPGTCFILQVPQRSITLPCPLFGDSEAGLGQLLLKRAVDGTTYSYVRRTQRRKLKYRFDISRPKASELRTYLLAYLASPITLTNWKGEIWYGFIMNNPFDLTAKERASCGERYEVDLEFEGVQVH